jgi:WD40 repeat protein
MYHKWAIENSPLQVYISALIFSPARSLIRGCFQEEEPKWITIKPVIGDKWSACLQTLEGHSDYVTSVAFSHDSTRLASSSGNCTVKIWDVSGGACLQTLEVDKVPKQISFDTTGSHLHTEIGTINISATLLVPSSTPTVIEPRNPIYQGLALSPDGAWIIYKTENLVWLPSENWPSCSAVIGKKIGIGVGTGRVWIFEILA